MEPLQAGSNEYENARQKRILRNQQVLADLGLNTAELPIRHAEVPAVSRKSKSEQVQLPLRRSRRQQGQPIEQQEKMDLVSDVYPKQEIQRLRADVRRNQNMDHLYQHNLMRVRSMSAFALAKRIGKIQNKAKMESLVQVLQDEGLTELANDAQQAMTEL
ncbi:TPA: hypothetical protein ACH3X3_010135 [Trebouxia sp. C0006]